MSWRIYVFKFNASYRTKQWRFGIWPVFHYMPTLAMEDQTVNKRWEYDDAVGVSIGIDYFSDESFSYGFHYTDIKYSASGQQTVSGNSLGLVWRIAFDVEKKF